MCFIMDLVTLIQKPSGCVIWLFHQPEFHSLKNKLFAMQWVFNWLIKVSFKEYFSSNDLRNQGTWAPTPQSTASVRFHFERGWGVLWIFGCAAVLLCACCMMKRYSFGTLCRAANSEAAAPGRNNSNSLRCVGPEGISSQRLRVLIDRWNRFGAQLDVYEV